MKFWNRISPKRAVDDFAGHWQQPTPYRWQIMGVSIAATFAVLMVFVPKSERAPPRRPDVTYISTWSPNRSQAEIIASNRANQVRKDEIAARRAAIEERKKEMYRALGRATFVDVDAMEADIERGQEAGAQPGSNERPAAGQAPATGDR